MKDFTIAMLSLAAEQRNRTGDQVGVWVGRLTTWLVVGNAGALVLALQVLKDSGPAPIADVAFVSGRFFGFGLVLAFLGASLGYGSLIWTRVLQGSVLNVVHADARTAAVEEWNRQRDTPLTDAHLAGLANDFEARNARLTELESKIGRGPSRLSLASLSVYVLSSAFFVAGMTLPLVKLQPVQTGPTMQELVELGAAMGGSAKPQPSPVE